MLSFESSSVPGTYDATLNGTESPITVRNKVTVTSVARASKHLGCGHIHSSIDMFLYTQGTG